MSRADIDFAGPGAFSFFERGYRYDPPPGIDLDRPDALRDPNTGIAFVAALDRARRGDRSALRVVLERCIEDEDPVLADVSRQLIGDAGSPNLLVDLLVRKRSIIYGGSPSSWWHGYCACDSLLSSRLCWVIPIVLDIYLEISTSYARRELGSLPVEIEQLVSPLASDGGPAGKIYPLFSARDDVGLVRQVLALWRPLREKHGDDMPILFGEPFDVRRVVEPLSGLASSTSRGPSVASLRQIYEATTGADCSNWFTPSHSPRPLQIAAEATRFLAEDAHRFQPGVRYFAGHPLLDPPDPRAKVWMEECLARLEARIAAAPIIIDTDDDDDDEDDHAPADYLYANLTSHPADPRGDAWARFTAAGQDAWLGQFATVGAQILAALETGEPDIAFDYDAAHLLADAVPSSQLRAIVDHLRPRWQDAADPRWQELLIIALGRSGLAWALAQAVEILALFDRAQAQAGPPWTFIRPALRAVPGREEIVAITKPDPEILRARVAANTSAYPDDCVLWEGEPLSLSTLVEHLAVEIAADEPRLGPVVRMRHILQTMTGIDLSALWLDGSHVDPIGGQTVIAQLRNSPLVQSHEPGTRYFFGHRIPD